MEHVTNARAPEPPAFALGIDTSRNKLDLALLCSTGKLRTTRVANDETGFETLLSWLSRSTKDFSTVHACLEASGGYEEAVALFLVEAGLRVSVVNPRQIKAYGEAQLKRSKTDRSDAVLIARFCQREQPLVWQVPARELRQLRQMTRGLQALKQDRDRTRNRLDRMEQGPARKALETILASYEAQIEALEGKIESHLDEHEELRQQRDLLVSIPGVGALTAALVLAELGDVTRFESARQAAAYAGLTPSHHESGTSVRRRSRLSKLGNSRLRHVLYFPAMSAMRHNEVVKRFAERLLGQGKKKMVVLGAAMRKLLHLCYGVLHSGRPFGASLHPTT